MDEYKKHLNYIKTIINSTYGISSKILSGKSSALDIMIKYANVYDKVFDEEDKEEQINDEFEIPTGL